MKKLFRPFMSFLLTLSMILSLSVNVFAAQTVTVDPVYDTSSEAYTLASKAYYWFSQRDDDKVAEYLEQLKEADESAYDFTKEIIDYWYEVDKEDFVNETLGVNVAYPGSGYDTTTFDDTKGIPTDLPTSNHAFVALGYALASPTLTDEQKTPEFKFANGVDDSDGFTWEYMELFMQDELKGRCDVTIRAAKMYPNSLIYCTGGGTSRVDPAVSEGKVMATYLEKVGGIDADRIITEDSASNTVQNGLNSMPEILEKGVKYITMITSDYHIRRGCMIFKGVAMRFAKADGSEPVELVSNIGFDTTKATEGVSSEYGAAGMGGVVNYQTSNTATKLTLSGKTKYNQGDELELTATVDYSLAGETDVTKDTKFTGFDSSTAGLQTVTGSFSYRSGWSTVTIKGTIDVFVLPPNLYTAGTDAATYMNAAIYYLSEGDKDSALEQLALLKEKCTDEEYEVAADIINYAIWVDETEVTSLLAVNTKASGPKASGYDDTTDIPTDLPTENHAFIGLGFGLATPDVSEWKEEDKFDEDGNYKWEYMEPFMKDELVGRCDVLIRLMKAYPNSLLFCTGGGTSKSDTNITEGMVMKAYILQTGEVEADRIFTEDKASNTVENGLYSMPEIIAEGVKTMTIVSSDYHVRRGNVIFKGVAQRYAVATNTKAVELIGQIGYSAAEQYDSTYNKDTKENLMMRLQMGLASTIGVSGTDAITGIEVSGKTEYKVGDELDLQTKAIYSVTGEKDVSSEVEYTGFDSSTIGTQTVTATYTVKVAMGPFVRETKYTDDIEVTVSGSLDNATIAEIPNQPYTGKYVKPRIKVTTEDDDLLPGVDYTVVYKNNKHKGTAQVIVTGIGNYSGKITAEFKIVNNLETETEIADFEDKVYNGEEQKQTVKVTDDGVELVEGTDYEVTYEDNVNVGKATVTIKGLGNYAGKVTKTFAITKAPNPMTATAKTKTVKYKKVKKAKQSVSPITVENAEGEVTYKKVSGSKKLTISATTGKVTVKKKTKKGTYKIKVTVTAAGNDNYEAGEQTLTVTVKVK
ncbi:MAG: YdcF family protein [Erysipelotrichaceae bacterium]|nr:YdcF family protein [Erysipelotrichaceae bacterium]